MIGYQNNFDFLLREQGKVKKLVLLLFNGFVLVPKAIAFLWRYYQTSILSLAIHSYLVFYIGYIIICFWYNYCLICFV